MENLTFENIRIHGEKPYNLVKLSPALQLVGTRPIVEPTPNNIAKGPGRRGKGSRGYGEFVVIPSDGPYIHNVVFRNIYTYGNFTNPKKERGMIVLEGISDKQDVSGITFEKVSYFNEPVAPKTANWKENEFISNIRCF